MRLQRYIPESRRALICINDKAANINRRLLHSDPEQLMENGTEIATMMLEVIRFSGSREQDLICLRFNPSFGLSVTVRG